MSSSRVSRRRRSACAIGPGIVASANMRCPARVSRWGCRSLDPRAAAARGARSMVIGVANAGGHIPPSWYRRAARSTGGGAGSGIGHARAAVESAGLAVGGGQIQPPTDRCANAAGRHSDRIGLEAFRTPAADGRHRLCARQEIHRARDRARPPGAADRCDVSRHRSNRHHDRRRGNADRLGGRRLHRGCRRSAFAQCAAAITSTSSKGRGRSFIRLTLESRWVCFTAASPIASSCATSRAARTCSAMPHFALPSIEQVIEQTIALGRLTNPDIRCAGISLNTAKLDAAECAARNRQRRKTAVIASRGSDAGRPEPSSACSMPVSKRGPLRRNPQRVSALRAAGPCVQGRRHRRWLCDRARNRRILPSGRALGRNRRDGRRNGDLVSSCAR